MNWAVAAGQPPHPPDPLLRLFEEARRAPSWASARGTGRLEVTRGFLPVLGGEGGFNEPSFLSDKINELPRRPKLIILSSGSESYQAHFSIKSDYNFIS